MRTTCIPAPRVCHGGREKEEEKKKEKEFQGKTGPRRGNVCLTTLTCVCQQPHTQGQALPVAPAVPAVCAVGVCSGVQRGGSRLAVRAGLTSACRRIHTTHRLAGRRWQLHWQASSSSTRAPPAGGSPPRTGSWSAPVQPSDWRHTPRESRRHRFLAHPGPPLVARGRRGYCREFEV
jgi:hypothetical protein